MTQVGQKTRLALERCAYAPLGEEGFFQSDCAAKALIGRNVDSPHAALPDLIEHEVTILQERVGGNHLKISLFFSSLTGLSNCAQVYLYEPLGRQCKEAPRERDASPTSNDKAIFSVGN